MYKHVFCNRTKNFFYKAEHYTRGIVQSQLRNIERICEELGGSIQTNTGIRSVSDPQVAGIATSGDFELYRIIFRF